MKGGIDEPIVKIEYLEDPLGAEENTATVEDSLTAECKLVSWFLILIKWHRRIIFNCNDFLDHLICRFVSNNKEGGDEGQGKGE